MPLALQVPVDLNSALAAESAVIVGSPVGAITFQNRPINRATLKDAFSGLVVASGDRTVVVHTPSSSAAELAASLLAQGKAISPQQTDELRRRVAAQLSSGKPMTPVGSIADAARGIQACDLHMHTVYSDGICSPGELALRGMYVFLDFMAITDHDQTAGAQLAQTELQSHSIGFPVIVGQEVTLVNAHFNAWPVTSLISNRLPIPEIIQAAHDQRALIQWNHPGYPGVPWQVTTIRDMGKGYDFDAIEHINDLYGTFRDGGVKLAFTGTSDLHGETLGGHERTLMEIGEFSTDNFKKTMKEAKVAAVAQWGPDWIYGGYIDATVRALLADGAALRAAKADRIRGVFKAAKLSAFLKDSRYIR